MQLDANIDVKQLIHTSSLVSVFGIQSIIARRILVYEISCNRMAFVEIEFALDDEWNLMHRMGEITKDDLQ